VTESPATDQAGSSAPRACRAARAARVALVLVLSAGVGLLAGALILGRLRARRAGRDLAGYERRLAELEKKYGQLARRPPPADPAERLAGMRAGRSELIRRDYRNMTGEIKRVTGLEGPRWERARAVLRRHFEPMDRALDAFERSPGWQVPDIQRSVGDRVPTTLNELRAAMGAGAWEKFDAWRRPKRGTAAVWRSPRYAYFLQPEEYRQVAGAGAAALRWNLAAPAVRKLYSLLGLARDRQSDLEATLRDHLARYTAAVGGLGAGARRPADAEERIAVAIELTEEKLADLLDEEKFKLYLRWRDALREPARGYFVPRPAGGGAPGE
jgi:hypothetical protein